MVLDWAEGLTVGLVVLVLTGVGSKLVTLLTGDGLTTGTDLAELATAIGALVVGRMTGI